MKKLVCMLCCLIAIVTSGMCKVNAYEAFDDTPIDVSITGEQKTSYDIYVIDDLTEYLKNRKMERSIDFAREDVYFFLESEGRRYGNGWFIDYDRLCQRIAEINESYGLTAEDWLIQ